MTVDSQRLAPERGLVDRQRQREGVGGVQWMARRGGVVRSSALFFGLLDWLKGMIWLFCWTWTGLDWAGLDVARWCLGHIDVRAARPFFFFSLRLRQLTLSTFMA